MWKPGACQNSRAIISTAEVPYQQRELSPYEKEADNSKEKSWNYESQFKVDHYGQT